MATAYQPLCRAIAAGDQQALDTAIANDPPAAKHWKPIVDAAFVGRAYMVRTLVAAGADPNVRSGSSARHTPLTRLTQHHATIAKHDGHAETLNALLAAGANANVAAGPDGLTPLAYATVAPVEHFIEALLPHTQIGIHIAAALLDNEHVEQALADPANAKATDARGRTPLDYVTLSGRWRTLGNDVAVANARMLIAAGVDVDQGEQFPEGDEVFNGTPLWRALSWQRNLVLAEFLLQRGADPNPGVFAASYSGGDEACDLLDRYGANWEQTFKGRTPLMDLMYFRRPAGSRWLIAKGVDVNAVGEDGKTALHIAALQGVRADYVRALVDAGGDRYAKDVAGATPLDYAVAKKRTKLIDLLR